MKKIIMGIICLVMITSFTVAPRTVSASTMAPAHKEQLIQLMTQLLSLLEQLLAKVKAEESGSKNHVTTPVIPVQKPTNTSKPKIYTNESYEYTLLPPKGWIIEPEVKVGENESGLLSMVRVHDASNTLSMSVAVSENGPSQSQKSLASGTETISIDGSSHTVYIFEAPQEFCKKNCTFFAIPVPRNGLWYGFGGNGDVSDYSDILSNFDFQ